MQDNRTKALYREALIESYLLGKVPRETVLRELGPEQLEEVDYQHEVLRRDVEWGRKSEARRAGSVEPGA